MTEKLFISQYQQPIAITGNPVGMDQPAVQVFISLDKDALEQARDIARIYQDFEVILGQPIEHRPVSGSSRVRDLLTGLLVWNRTLQIAAGWPAFCDGQVEAVRQPDGTVGYAMLFPCLWRSHAAAEAGMQWVIDATNLLLTGQPLERLKSALPGLLDPMRKVGPAGMNTLRFIEAAHEAGIPWRRIHGNIYQFGWGAQSQWLDSSFTEQTSRLSSRLTRNKLESTAVLKRAGIPVPLNSQVANADHAVKLAEMIGYPVVIKPVDKDGGLGVAADLRNPKAVRKAYAEAKKLSQSIMIEKHVSGNDYRLQVYKGEVIWATHRVPGGITGDGVRSIPELLELFNAEESRGDPGTNATLKRIPLDEEARELLTEQGLTPESVPEPGRFVRLRRAANVASGGTPQPVLEKLHPDNRALAINAADALRLDLAGVDLLIPDIGISWLESGAAICEVNAQPQLWPTLPALLLKKLVRGDGRIPVLVILGAEENATWVTGLTERIAKLGIRTGLASSQGATLSGVTIMRGPCELHDAGEALLVNRNTDCIIMLVHSFDLLRTGLPFDRFDALVLDGAPPNPEHWPQWLGFAQLMTRICKGPVLANEEQPRWSSLIQSFHGRPGGSMNIGQISDSLVRSFRKQEKS